MAANLQDISGNTTATTNNGQMTVETSGSKAATDQRLRELMNFDAAKTKAMNLVNSWTTEIEETDRRRRLRDINVNLIDLRNRGVIKPYETLIPVRTIDTNIRTELPAMIAYLKQSRRIAVFRCVTNPDIICDKIEDEFTRVFTYKSWELAFFKVLDGSATHGWDAVEICYDKNKPGRFSVDYVGHDRLYFPLGAIELQASEFVLRRYDLSKLQLEDFVARYNFNKDAVERLVQTKIQNGDTDPLLTVYKRFFKYDGVVYISWMSLESDQWLREPEKFSYGLQRQVEDIVEETVMIQQPDPITGQPVMQSSKQPKVITKWVDVDEVSYPFEILPYYETEQPKLFDRKGRCYMDEYKQEAQTAVWSAFINAVNRAHCVFSSPKNPVSGGAPKQLETVLLNDSVMSEPMEFWSPPWPNPMVLQALESLETRNQIETANVAFAVDNRQDSRKTAKEVESSEQQTALLNSVKVTLLSIFLRSVCERCWRILRYYAQREIVVFVPIPNPQGGIVNDPNTWTQQYDLYAAGDVDVIKRNEKLQRMMQSWPVIQNTPAAQIFLIDFIKTAFPDDADRYVAAIEQGDQKKQLIMSLGHLLKAAVTDPKTGQLEPQFASMEGQLAQLNQQAAQVLQQP